MLQGDVVARINGVVVRLGCNELFVLPSLQVFVYMSMAHPTIDEEEVEMYKRYFDPIKFGLRRKSALFISSCQLLHCKIDRRAHFKLAPLRTKPVDTVGSLLSS